MAKDLTSIPITTVAFESSFSTRKKILTPYQSHFLPENVEATLCTKNLAFICFFFNVKKWANSTQPARDAGDPT